jgi:lipopolysaccharide transport system ATP-binding protein
MSDTVIRVENLGKRYRIGLKEKGNKSLKEQTKEVFTSPFKYLKNVLSEPSPDEVFWALKDVSFEVKRGEVLGVIGRNGAGKSTLLKILSRITEPTKGFVEIRGRVGSLLEVGTGFHPDLTGRENTYLNGTIMGMKKREIDRRFDEIVDFAEVEKFIDTPVKHYSSGMYTRLAFAVAAHLTPEILIVDEVLAVGDLQFQKKCLGKMGEIAQVGRTVIFVSHSMGSVSTLCNKAVFMEKGKIRETGTVDQITTSYMNDIFQNKIDDLAQLRTPGLGNSIYFSDIQLISGDKSNILFGEPISYSLTIKAETKADDLIIGTSIFNKSDICVGSVLTEETFSLDSGGEITLQLKISATNLAPGSYYSSFGIGQKGTSSCFDAIVGKPAFQILPISKTNKEQVASWQSSWGNIFFRDYQLLIGESL